MNEISYIKRRLLPDIESHLGQREISLITGPRQAGKTTLMRRIENLFQAKGRKTLWLNLDFEEDARHLSSQGVGSVPRAFRRNPNANREIPGYSLSRGPATLRTPICFFSSQFANDDGSAGFFRSMTSDGFLCLPVKRMVKAVPPVGLPQVRIRVPSESRTFISVLTG